MGQEISALITNQQLEIDREIVHFAAQECTIIPLDIDPAHVEYFVTQAAQFDRLEDLLLHLEMKDGSDWDNGSNADIYGDGPCQHTLTTVISWIRSMQLQHFILEYYSDFASQAMDCYFVLVLNGNIVKKSVMIGDYGIDWDAYVDFTQQLGVDHYWYCDETKYFRYSNAEEVYRSQQGR